MLSEFLQANDQELIQRCRSRVLQRRAPAPSEHEMEHGIPLFLEQLTRTLQAEEANAPTRAREIAGPAGGRGSEDTEVGLTAGHHGRELLEHGFTVDQVIHNYGDLCQAITELAIERKAPIDTREFQTLNRCLDNAIADAVTAFSQGRDMNMARKSAAASDERMGTLAHEIRNLLNTAMLAQSAIKAGGVGLHGATGSILDRSLIGLRHLVDRSLGEVRPDAPARARSERIALAEFVAEVRVSAVLEAQSRDIGFRVSPIDPALAVDADRDQLLSALGNLLQNAFKFTAPHSEVCLDAGAAGEEVFIEVRDRCGGLPPNFERRMFQPFVQGSADRSGVGLGLAIARRAVQDNGGTLTVRDMPGVGCAFRITFPKRAVAPPAEAKTVQAGGA